MNCLASIIKYILYVFNIIFVACGIMLIVLGSIMLADMGSLSDYPAASETLVMPIVIISFGCVIFVISFFGCCGAIRENKFCTYVYSLCMFILFCLQVALVIVIFVNYDQFLNAMSALVTDAWNSYNQNNQIPMDTLQMSFQCCGVNGYQDYTGTLPSSCCGSNTGACDPTVAATKPGCQDKFTDFWATNMDIVSYTGIGIAIVEAITFSFACILVNNIRRRQS